jgi:hypothetical protein
MVVGPINESHVTEIVFENTQCTGGFVKTVQFILIWNGQNETAY